MEHWEALVALVSGAVTLLVLISTSLREQVGGWRAVFRKVRGAEDAVSPGPVPTPFEIAQLAREQMAITSSMYARLQAMEDEIDDLRDWAWEAVAMANYYGADIRPIPGRRNPGQTRSA